MNPEAFRAWRLRLGFQQQEVPRLLGRSLRMIVRYESARWPIRLEIRLAM